jgi:hypothetical protein
MFRWVVVAHERREVLVKSIVKGWSGGDAVLTDLEVPGRKKSTWLCVASTGGATARRQPRWPEVLVDWSDINEDPLFPESEAPVLAEEVSGLGADAFIAHGAPGLAKATVGWYAKGALAAYEHVGSATVSWTPEEGLGRPFDGSAKQLAARGYQKLAELVGDQAGANVAERIQLTNQAMGEALISRAFLPLLDTDPPAIDELAGMIARSRTHRWRLAD